ncbi:MAG: argininosuccinate synthase [Candidatus Neomarinimicrobiota bacterium]|nr:argininosuccinate synthase [Candidatus Neomarinimicrobiota bacterium]
MKNKNKIILAYSGGLDTSVILKWLVNLDYEVVCFIGDIGQSDDFITAKIKAEELGASKVIIEDLKNPFIIDYVYPALQGNAIYEGRYLLGTALARPVLAKAQIEIAHNENASIVSHGSTAKGNDQVRFELAYHALDPNIKVFSPWRDEEFSNQFKGRNDLLNYAEKWKIPISASKGKPYSEDENLIHISHEAGILEDPSKRPDPSVFSLTEDITNTPDEETKLEIKFKDGIPISVTNLVDNSSYDNPLDIINYLNLVGRKNGIGRVDMVENRFIGIKSRGVYETPGATILFEAHRDLEGIAMDKEVMHIRDLLIPKFSELIYNGFWFSPEMDFLLTAIRKSQEAVDGVVRVALIKGNIIMIGRESPTSLYDQDLSSMDIEGGFDAKDSEGFININSIRLMAHKIVLQRKDPYNWRGEEKK